MTERHGVISEVTTAGAEVAVGVVLDHESLSTTFTGGETAYNLVHSEVPIGQL